MENIPRMIYIVNAYIVDKNGTFSYIDGFPKQFDSSKYGNDIQKTFRRADGEMSAAWSAMCKVDERKVQTVEMTDIYGNHLKGATMGDINPEIPEE